MQDRYAGDFGDYVKLALLRALTSGAADSDMCPKLGVIWWLVRNKEDNNDGRHTRYLDRPNCWRQYDPILFDCLRGMMGSEARSVEQIERLGLFNGCKFFSEPVPHSIDIRDRRVEREQWVERARTAIATCDIVFLDPDNGIAPLTYSVTRKTARKSVTIEELKAIGGARPLVVYHHQTRRKGGHQEEIGYLANRLKHEGFSGVGALRSSSFSPRVFFLLNGLEWMRGRAEKFALNWNGVKWIPDP
jgi:hypothetical protein